MWLHKNSPKQSRGVCNLRYDGIAGSIQRLRDGKSGQDRESGEPDIGHSHSLAGADAATESKGSFQGVRSRGVQLAVRGEEAFRPEAVGLRVSPLVVENGPLRSRGETTIRGR